MSLPGFHFAPVRKSSRPISFMAGTPFANRKIQMSTTAKMEVSAQRKNTMCIRFSRKFFINLSPIQAQGESLRPVSSVCEFAYARSPQSVMSPT